MKHIQLKIRVLALPLVLLAPALRAKEPTPWDRIGETYIAGAITITAKSGKQVKGTGSVRFGPHAVEFGGIAYPRQEVKEVVIRRHREAGCGSLALGLLPFLLLVDGIRNQDIEKGALPAIVIFISVIVGMAAVTGPPCLLITGIRNLKPAQLLYKVVP
jgi:hypothetical protein